MLIAGQVLLLRLVHHFTQEFARHVAIQQPIPVLREHRNVPHWLIHVHTYA
jgi:hypothetical protein